MVKCFLTTLLKMNICLHACMFLTALLSPISRHLKAYYQVWHNF